MSITLSPSNSMWIVHNANDLADLPRSGLHFTCNDSADDVDITGKELEISNGMVKRLASKGIIEKVDEKSDYRYNVWTVREPVWNSLCDAIDEHYDDVELTYRL